MSIQQQIEMEYQADKNVMLATVSLFILVGMLSLFVVPMV